MGERIYSLYCKGINIMPHLKSKSTPQLKKKAIEVFNAWIRERDKEKPCISCGMARVEQAGHFYSAGHHNALRFNEDNVHGQCVRCNYYLSGNLNRYRVNLEKKIGAEKLARLDFIASIKKPHKDDKFFLIEIINKYKIGK